MFFEREKKREKNEWHSFFRGVPTETKIIIFAQTHNKYYTHTGIPGFVESSQSFVTVKFTLLLPLLYKMFPFVPSLLFLLLISKVSAFLPNKKDNAVVTLVISNAVESFISKDDNIVVGRLWERRVDTRQGQLL